MASERAKLLEFPGHRFRRQELDVASERSLGLAKDASWSGKRNPRTGGLGSLLGGCQHVLDDGGDVVVGRLMVHNAGEERELGSPESHSTDTRALGE
jgi:hypothetical protein